MESDAEHGLGVVSLFFTGLALVAGEGRFTVWVVFGVVAADSEAADSGGDLEADFFGGGVFFAADLGVSELRVLIAV